MKVGRELQAESLLKLSFDFMCPHIKHLPLIMLHLGNRGTNSPAGPRSLESFPMVLARGDTTHHVES